MNPVQELLSREDFFDAAIMRHGFTDYMRDYEVIVGARGGPPHTDIHRYHFVGCVEAHYETAVSPSTFAASLPDDFVLSGPDYPDKPDPHGFIWGVRYSNAYPGLTYVAGSTRAERWTRTLGVPMHEITLQTEAFTLTLVFAEARYEFLGHEPAVTFPTQYPIGAPKRGAV